MADDKARERAAKRILVDLERLKPRIDKTEADLKALYTAREDAFMAGRALSPPLVQKVMGVSSGVTEAAVIHAIKRREERDRKAAAAKAAGK